MDKISAVIITRNEEHNIVDCLQTLDFADEIIVVDSGSKDRTISLAKKYTKKVFSRKWDSFAAQKNYAISKTRNDWVLSIDADERVSEELKQELVKLVFNADGYQIPIKNFFLGKWLKYGGQYPDYHLRLFKKSKGRYAFGSKDVHETVVLKTGVTVKLTGPLLHYSYLNAISYFNKFNSYTRLEASGRFQHGKKASWYGIFVRSLNRFVKWYFFKLGFLDGIRGLIYCVFSAFYVFVTEIKLFELYRYNRKDLKWKS